MTPREKARELYYTFFEGHDLSFVKFYANRCVDEILKLDCLTDEAWLNVPDEYKVQYWREVKSEIEKI